jgi:hypothetical protein
MTAGTLMPRPGVLVGQRFAKVPFSLGCAAAFAASVAARPCVAASPKGEPVPAWEYPAPAPAGYRVVRKHSWEVAGIATLGGAYGLSLTLYAALSTACSVPVSGSASDGSCTTGLDDATPWLALPVAGPFIGLTYASVRHDRGARFMFPFLGTAQVAGAAMLIYGLAVPHYRLRSDRASTVWVAPLVARGGGGAAIVGTF